MQIGLRIDVDTFRGTKYGVPALCRLLADHAVSASFFFSVGPDNMGRHLWRLIRPRFFLKMLRTKASSLYGWDILHAWDHHGWQANIERMNGEAIFHSLDRGVALLTGILGRQPTCSAVPAWKCNDLVLLQKAKFPFSYNSDCKGEEIFFPLIRGEAIFQPQIPVTLPTYDEVIGHNGISDTNYNDYILSLMRPEKLNVLTVHAEVEGIICLEMFDRFLKMVRSIGADFVPLKALLSPSQGIRLSTIAAKEIPGRDGWVSCQEVEE